MTDSPSLPRHIGRYEIKSLLGAGAMGSVYLAEDPRIKRKLAIKVVKLDSIRSEQDRKELLVRFEREAEISGLLNDPGIVTIYDLGDSELGPFLAMEFVQGAPLDALIKSGEASTLSMGCKIRILAGIAAALDHAHSHNIVHRDVKPANVMLTENRRPKLMDFGIAKREDAGLTQTGTFLGTPSYASPEQIKEGHSTHKSDIFSLGVLAFELLSGSLPFPGNSINTILYRIVNEPPVEIHPPVMGLISDAWKRIFFKVLAKDPIDRHGTCSDFVRQLLDAAVDITEAERIDILSLLPQSEMAPPIAALTIRTGDLPVDPKQTVVAAKPRKRRWPYLMVAVLLAAVGAGGWWMLRPKGMAIQLQSTPPGALVEVDGTPMGQTPLPAILRPDQRVTMSLRGYEPVSHTLKPEDRTVSLTLEPRISDVRLDSEPGGALVVMDGTPLSVPTPVKVRWDHSRPHALTLTRRTDRGELVAAQDFKAGETAEGTLFKLQPQGDTAPPSLHATLKLVGSYPVRLRMDGKDLGEVTPNHGTKVPPGEVKVEVSNPKVFLRLAFSLNLRAGETKSVTLPELVSLTVETHPRSGILTVDGVATGIESDGMTPIRLTRGAHVVGIQGASGIQKSVRLDGDQFLKFKY